MEVSNIILAIILLLIFIGLIIWIFIDEDRRTKQHIDFLIQLDRLKDKDKKEKYNNNKY